MTRKPEFEDPCKCGHKRYHHIGTTDGCTMCDECSLFKRKVDFRLLADICLRQTSNASYMRVSRAIALDVVEIVGAYSLNRFTGQLTIFGKHFSIEDSFEDNEYAFGEERKFIS